MDTHISLTNEALDAMIEIRELVKKDQLKDSLIGEIKNHLGLET